ncbi:MAG: stage II sporulation protein D [Sporolactobacillus sp.]
MKRTTLIVCLFLLAVLIIPMAIVLPFQHRSDPLKLPIIGKTIGSSHAESSGTDPAITVSVYRSSSEKTEHLDLDHYLIGVVGSEMPAKFPIEALKAQAFAARTYILARMIQNPDVRVTDTVQNQVYHSPAEFKRLWGKDYQWRMNRVTRAVEQTRNEVITYRGSLISPAFFSTSNGRTENAQNYWENAVPYLRSVASPWDKSSPKFYNTKKIPAADVQNALGITLGEAGGEIGTVLRKTPTGHVAAYRINGKTFSGRSIREKLALSSTDFTLVRSGDQVIARTIGSGHDIGMSQYGAAGMARSGKTAAQIVTHYYSGTKVTTLTLKTQTALARK